MGISLSNDYKFLFQNRSHFVTSQSSTQWKTLDIWIEQHQSDLFKVLEEPGKYILFGEWLYAKHSIHYTNLPGYFIAFDIFDLKQGQFLSVVQRDQILSNTTIPIVTRLGNGKYTLDQLKQMLKTQQSSFYNGPLEGLYFRIDNNQFLKERAKAVRSDFLGVDNGEEVEHWSKKQLVKNIVRY